MSLHAWEWEEDPASIEPISSITSFYQSTSECDVEEHLKAKARAQESDSDRPCSSIESSSEPASTFSSDVPHVVPCKFTISLAFPVNMGQKGKYASLIEKYKKHPKTDSSVTKMRRFYHIEYFLLPDDEEPKKVDILLFPMVAKVFLESGVKTVKPWHEGDKAWVSWEQTFNINVTKELLKKINFHKITLRLWNTKDKMSRKVRYYRLKTAGFTDDVGAFHKSEVRHLVLNQRKLSEQGIENTNIVREESNQEYPPGKQEKTEKHPKSLQGSHQAEPETSSKNSEEYEKSLKMDDSSTIQWNVSRTPTISLAGASTMEIKELIESESLSSLTNILDRQRSQIKGKDSEGRRKIQRRHKKPLAEEEADPTLTGPRKQSAFSIQLAVMPLLAGWQTIMSRGSEKSANILDCLLTLKTEVPIMTEEQKQDLNPLTIKIKCASCLPSQPVPIQELEVSLLHSLLQDITMINAKALGLDSYPVRTLQQILSAFKVRVRVQEQQHLDVLTGFHLLDGKTHLFILEGLADQGLRQLWENHQSWIPRSEHRKYKVLYNSQLLFRSRLYGDLEAILYHVHLFQPTELLLQQAVFFLRDTERRRVFQALARIHDICYNSTTLWDVTVRDLLPSSAMIKDLSQEFGMPLSQEELTDEKLFALPPQPAPNLEDYHSRNSTLTLEIHAHQEKYLQWRSAMLLKNKDKKHSFIQKNITEAYQVSKKPPKSVAKVIKISAPANKAVYNYSTQTMNSTELAKKELYQEMAKEPRKRFTYSQDYLSAMVEPLDLKEEEKKAQKKSRQAWLTARGFQVTGLQSDTESSFQDLKLPPIKELNEEWKENSLFANVLEPVLDRDRWSWDRHHVDFDLYKKPPPFLELPPSPAPKPVTVRKKKGNGPIS
ncbi:uncharacterized protein CFAP92 isoform X11 [Pan troglodytes]|uniref:uncharacterized protein CFAP92 isoform X11 n=1 Tax=Pan troglodytes TaxID=9598 RepID=UPI00301353A8